VNLNALQDVTEGEIIPKDKVPEGTTQEVKVDTAVKTTIEQAQAAIQASNQKQEELQRVLAQILKKHEEKGSLAMDILKSAISQKTETLLHGATNFDTLVKQSFALADAFKSELDQRYTNDVTETTNKFFGKSTEPKPEEKTKKLN
jgi:hypothetical protein